MEWSCSTLHNLLRGSNIQCCVLRHRPAFHFLAALCRCFGRTVRVARRTSTLTVPPQPVYRAHVSGITGATRQSSARSLAAPLAPQYCAWLSRPVLVATFNRPKRLALLAAPVRLSLLLSFPLPFTAAPPHPSHGAGTAPPRARGPVVAPGQWLRRRPLADGCGWRLRLPLVSD